MGRVVDHEEEQAPNDNTAAVALRLSHILQLTKQSTTSLEVAVPDNNNEQTENPVVLGDNDDKPAAEAQRTNDTVSSVSSAAPDSNNVNNNNNDMEKGLVAAALKDSTIRAPSRQKIKDTIEETRRIQKDNDEGPSEGSLTTTATETTTTTTTTTSLQQQQQANDDPESLVVQDTTTTTPGAVSVAGIGNNNDAESSHFLTVTSLEENPSNNTAQDDERRNQSSSQKDLVQAYLVSQQEAEATLLDEKELEEQFWNKSSKQRQRKRVIWALSIVLVLVIAVVVSVTLTSDRPSSSSNPVPNHTPSAAPTMTPTFAPTTSAAPTTNCGLTLDMECQSNNDDCQNLLNVRGRCQDERNGGFLKLGLVYTGDTCAQAEGHVVKNPHYTCTDYNSSNVTQAFVVIREWNDPNTIYFWGLVERNADVYLTNNLYPLEQSEVLDVTLYQVDNNSSSTAESSSQPNLSPDNLIQRIQFGSNCAAGVQLGERYGGLRVVELETQQDGVVSCITTARWTVSLWLLSDNSDDEELRSMTLQTLEIASNRPDVAYINKTDEIHGKVLISSGSVGGLPTQLPSAAPSLSPISRHSDAPSWTEPPATTPTWPPRGRRRVLRQERNVNTAATAPVLWVVTTEPFSMVLDLCQNAVYQVCVSVSAMPNDNFGNTCWSQDSHVFAAGGSPFEGNGANATVPPDWESTCG